MRLYFPVLAAYLKQSGFESRRSTMNVHVHPSWVQVEVLPTSSFHSGGAAFNFSPGEEWYFILNPCPPFTHRNQHLPLHRQPCPVSGG